MFEVSLAIVDIDIICMEIGIYINKAKTVLAPIIYQWIENDRNGFGEEADSRNVSTVSGKHSKHTDGIPQNASCKENVPSIRFMRLWNAVAALKGRCIRARASQ